MPSYTLTEEQRAVAFAAVQVASEAAALLRCVADDDDTTIGEPQATLEDLLELRCALAPEPDAGGEITYTVAAHKPRSEDYCRGSTTTYRGGDDVQRGLTRAAAADYVAYYRLIEYGPNEDPWRVRVFADGPHPDPAALAAELEPEVQACVAARRQRRAEFLAKEAEHLAAQRAAKQRAADKAELARLQAKLGVSSPRPQYVEPGDESWRNTPGRVKTGGAT